MGELTIGAPALSRFGSVATRKSATKSDSREELAAARRAQVLEAAARVISTKGAAGLTFADIAATAGVSVGLIQHYFRTRSELLAEAFGYFNDTFVHAWEDRAFAEEDPIARLAGLIDLMGSARADWDQRAMWSVWLEYWGLCNRDTLVRVQDSSARMTYAHPVRHAIRQGVDQGAFHPRAPVDEVAECLLAAADGLFIRALLEPERMPPDSIVGMLARLADNELGSGTEIARAVRERAEAGPGGPPRRPSP
jgi:TetR/AcrR family transcriptional regulator, transcriptional repressor of bet genes